MSEAPSQFKTQLHFKQVKIVLSHKNLIRWLLTAFLLPPPHNGRAWWVTDTTSPRVSDNGADHHPCCCVLGASGCGKSYLWTKILVIQVHCKIIGSFFRNGPILFSSFSKHFLTPVFAPIDFSIILLFFSEHTVQIDGAGGNKKFICRILKLKQKIKVSYFP